MASRLALCSAGFVESCRLLLPAGQHAPVGKERGESDQVERWNHTPRQRTARLGRQTLSIRERDSVRGIRFRLSLDEYVRTCYALR